MRYRRTSDTKRALVVEMLICGLSYKSIAEQMNISIATVGVIFRDNKEAIESGRTEKAVEAKARLQGMAQHAADALFEILQDGNERQKLDVCKFILTSVLKTSNTDSLAFIRSLI